MLNKPKQFKKLISNGKANILPVANDALSAMLIEEAGFDCFGIGGFGTGAVNYGVLDIGIINLKEIKEAAEKITAVVQIPALVDADTGYGGPNQAANTIKTLEKAGAGAIFIEDQVWPKRCGHFNGKKVISALAMQAKINAAIKARINKDLVIMARTDALAVNNINDAIHRGKLYYQAGADMVWIEAPTSLDQIKQIAKELKNIPMLINLIEGGKTPLLDQKILQDLGFKLIAYPLTTLLTYVKSTQDILMDLKQRGTTKKVIDKMLEFKEIKNILRTKK